MMNLQDEKLDRASVIAALKRNLQERSGKSWSVTGGRGTAYGWLTIQAPPARRTWSHRLRAGAVADMPENYEEYDAGKPAHNNSPEDRAELATLLGLERVHCQGVSIAASHEYYREYLARSRGEAPAKIATPYWD
jgi:hypothetical protein